MQGILITAPGVFEYRKDLQVPVPKKDEVRIKVLAAGICGTDVHIVRGDESLINYITTPLVLGHEFCGEIDSCGENVTGFKQGDYVSAEMHEVCYTCRACKDNKLHACENTKIHGLHLDGSFADFTIVPAKNVVKLPKSIPIKVAAIMDALGNAVHAVCKTNVRDRIVSIIGFGPIGAMACEVALFSQASHLYVVDINEKALERAAQWDRTKRANGQGYNS
jgi:threonine 3-dehydrogenase